MRPRSKFVVGVVVATVLVVDDVVEEAVRLSPLNTGNSVVIIGSGSGSGSGSKYVKFCMKISTNI